LPLPLLIAIQDQKAKRKVLNIISRPKITKSKINRLVNVVLEAEPVLELKNEMQLLIEDGKSLTNILPVAKLQSTLRLLLSFMLEDL
jgi:hypothetical protein